MTNQAIDSLPGATQSDLKQLRQKLTGMIGMALVLAGGFGAWLLLPGPNFQLWVFLIPFSILIEGVLCCYFRFRRPALSRVILLLGPTLSLSLALKLIQSPAAPFFASLIVISSAAISPSFGFVAALLNTVSLYLFAFQSVAFLPSLAVLWLAAALEWISSRGLYTALDWAWNSQQRASWLLKALRDHQGELNRTIVALTEATRRLQRVGHELAEARLRAEDARDLKERFAANISHELRTPLNLILGFSETIYFTPDVYGDVEWPSTLKRDIHQIYQSSQQLSELVNDVLDLSRLDAAQMPIHKEMSDLGAVIREAVSAISGLARARDLELKVKLPADLVPLHFDRTRIRQVLLNLLKNAVRFTEQGSVTVSVELTDREAIVSVADTGLGISEDELPRMFDEFHQVDMSLRRQKEGAGLGLAISKRFVELHGGCIWLESEPGEGSTFYFSLPLSPGASVGHLIETLSLRPSERPHEPVVVVVDPTPAVGMLLSRYLKGYQVLGAQNLEEARDLIARWHPRALVVNVLPDAEAMRRAYDEALRLMPPRVPVLFCSIPSESWVSLRLGVRGCLSKPVTRQQLSECLSGFDGVRDVLVVDDDRGFVELVGRYLASANGAYGLRAAYDGEQALAQIRAKRPDLMLLDLIMPGMDGFQVLEVLSSDRDLRDIPVLVVTATDYGADMLDQRGSMISVGRQKGFTATEVIQHLQAILDVTQPEYPVGIETVPPAAQAG